MAINSKQVAIYSWLVVTLVGGVTVGSLFGLHGRQLVFPVMLLLGGYALLLQWLTGRRFHAVSTNITAEIPAVSADQVLPDHVVSRKSDGMGRSLIDEDRVMTADEAREWLNKLLVKRQRK